MKRASTPPLQAALVLAVSLLAVALPAGVAHADTCVFTVAMQSGTDVNNLDLVVNYAATGGNVEGAANRPDCARALPGNASAAFRDEDDESLLRAAVISLGKFSAPANLFGCRIFYDSEPPLPGQFSILVTAAGRDGEDDNVVPLPVLFVSKVECPGELPEPTTTTTLPEAGNCGTPESGGETPTTSDALYALRASVDVVECTLCECDVNDSGNIAAGDALLILRAAVGLPVVLTCPLC